MKRGKAPTLFHAWDRANRTYLIQVPSITSRSEMESTGMAGVEIREMRERIRQLGGTLEVNSNGRGTLIRSPIADWQNRVDSYGMTDN
jgi:hypothetical protein